MKLNDEQRAKFDEVCSRMIGGESVKQICKGEGAPVPESTLYYWLHHDETGELRDTYNFARGVQADRMAEEILEISDDGTNDWMEKRDKDGKIVGWQLNGEHVQRSKIRADNRKWLAGKLKPKVYGEKLELETTRSVADMDIAAVRSELKQLSDLFGFELPPRLLGEEPDEPKDGG